MFIEVNVGGETSKSGVPPPATLALAEHLRARCPHLRLEGLMTVPPYDPDPERSRPHFAALRRLAAGFELFIVTNQNGVAKGLLTIDEVNGVNARVASRLAEAHHRPSVVVSLGTGKGSARSAGTKSQPAGTRRWTW